MLTRTDQKGRTESTTVTDFPVPAGGSAVFEVGDNDLELHKGKTRGVVSVTVTVTEIRTTDGSGETVVYPAEGPTGTIAAPDTP